MGQFEVNNLLKENVCLNIKEIRDKLNLGKTNMSVNHSLNQMIKYNEVKAYSVNNGNSNRVIYYGLIENSKKMYKQLKKLYKNYGSIEEFKPLCATRIKHKGGKLRRLKILND